MSEAVRAARGGAAAAPAPRRAPAPRPPRPRHLSVVDAQARRRAGRLRLAIWGFALVTAISVFVAVAFQVMLAQSEFQLDRLSKQTAAAQLRYQQARLHVAQLAAPDRIVERAHRLGMVDAANIRYVSPPPDSGSGSQPTVDLPAGTSGADWEKVKRHLVAQP